MAPRCHDYSNKMEFQWVRTRWCLQRTLIFVVGDTRNSGKGRWIAFYLKQRTRPPLQQYFVFTNIEVLMLISNFVKRIDRSLVDLLIRKGDAAQNIAIIRFFFILWNEILIAECEVHNTTTVISSMSLAVYIPVQIHGIFLSFSFRL